MSYACWTRDKVLQGERALTVPYHGRPCYLRLVKASQMGGLSGEEARKLHVPIQPG